MPEPTQTQRDQLDLVVAPALIVVAALLAWGPALIVAVALALAIDRRAWRRWPATLAGGALVGAAVALGGWSSYWATWVHVWNATVRDASEFDPERLLGLAPLGLTAGILLGPALQIAVHHRNEHEATRHHREVSARRRAQMQAERAMAHLDLPAPQDRTVLGLRLDGSLRGWQIHRRGRPIVAPLAPVWERQALILGETGSGKTVTALALASELLRAGWDVHWIDGKANRGTRLTFLAAASSLGVEARDGAAESIDGWRGGPEAVINRLLVTQNFTEPYYEGIARTVLRAVVGNAPPRSFAELVDRIDKKLLTRALRDDRRAAGLVHQLPDKEIAGVRFRYDGIAWAVGDALDGAWSYEDAHASYVPVGRPENRHQAAEVGAFILEDLLHWALARKQRNRRAVVIVDEFSKLSARPGAAVDLVERARASGVGIVLIGQTWASIGPDETIRGRLAGTVGTVILHQLKQPDEAAALAGTKWVMERIEQTDVLLHTGLGSQRAGNQFVVHPDQVRSLDRGNAFLIHAGSAIRIAVRGRSRHGSHPHVEFDLPAAEIRAAQNLRRGDRYSILYVSHVLTSDERAIYLLPNPLGTEGLGRYRTIGSGLRLRFTLP